MSLLHHFNVITSLRVLSPDSEVLGVKRHHVNLGESHSGHSQVDAVVSPENEREHGRTDRLS